MNVALGVGLGRAVSEAAEAAPAENLLTWTEAFDNAAWTKSNASVSANATTDPSAGSTADRVTFAASGFVRQVTGVAASSGSAALQPVSVAVVDVWQRFSVTGTFDGAQYTFSVFIKNDGAFARLRLDQSGGFLRCTVEDLGDEATVDLWGAQLETGSSPTTYVPRTT